nr:MAG TPA: hypothetical protein [Caudoviricetes sp.]
MSCIRSAGIFQYYRYNRRELYRVGLNLLYYSFFLKSRNYH